MISCPMAFFFILLVRWLEKEFDLIFSLVIIFFIHPIGSIWLNYFLFKFVCQGFEGLCPDKASMERTVLPSVDAFRKGDMEGARNLLRVSLQVLLVGAVNKIILASDDLVGILPDDDPLLKKCIDPLDALVREAIECARAP